MAGSAAGAAGAAGAVSAASALPGGSGAGGVPGADAAAARLEKKSKGGHGKKRHGHAKTAMEKKKAMQAAIIELACVAATANCVH